MNSAALTLADLTTLIGLVAAIGALWWRIEGAIAKTRDDAQRRIEKVATDLTDFKDIVAREYARNGYLRDVEDRVLKRIDQVVTEIHGLRQEISEAVKSFARPAGRKGG